MKHIDLAAIEMRHRIAETLHASLGPGSEACDALDAGQAAKESSADVPALLAHIRELESAVMRAIEAVSASDDDRAYDAGVILRGSLGLQQTWEKK